jgi:hypothetical protein
MPVAGSSRTTFTKRAKERARQERRAEKAQKRSLRKEEKPAARPELSTGQPVIALDEDGQPLPLDFHDF